MQARTVLTTLQEHLTVLFPPPPPSKYKTNIWLPRQPNFSAGDKALVGRWRIYLKWEEGNPLEIEEKDKAQLHTRLQGVYRKALVRMRFFSEIW
jgi:cleavage stimulation factor subunit 3